MIYVPTIITPKTCEAIISKTERKGFVSGYNSSFDNDTTGQQPCQICNFLDSRLSKRLFDIAKSCSIAEGWNFALHSFDKQMDRYLYTNKYLPNMHRGWHQDGGPMFDDVIMAKRKLTVLVMLSDPCNHKGGNTEFMGGNCATVLSRGDVIIFPSYEWHRTTPLLKGVRYSLASFITGPKFK